MFGEIGVWMPVIKDPPPYYHQLDYCGIIVVVNIIQVLVNIILVPDGIYDSLKEAMRRGEDHR